MTVIATDGYPVDPVTTDALIIGMGERYDVLVTVPRSGAFPLVAVAEGKGAQALAVLRAGHAALPMPDVHPAQLDGQLLTLADLHATAKVALRTGTPDRTYRVALTGAMMAFDWGIRAPTQRGISLQVKTGQRIRLVLANQTRMWHPIHLHGHTFRVVTGNGVGPRKDRPHRRQPRPMGAALPQHLPRRGRHDDHPVLRDLSARVGHPVGAQSPIAATMTSPGSLSAVRDFGPCRPWRRRATVTA